MQYLMDERDLLQPQGGINKLYPYAKGVYYHPDGTISMTLEIYNQEETKQFTFGFTPSGYLREFLDLIYAE
jgi:hypothetical protein